MIGKTLNQYRITRQLGSGGMGEVYLAEDAKLGREVALKVLPPEMAGDAERRMRFEREARAVAKLNHPNIVTIYSVETDAETHFFTMEMVHGDTLESRLRDDGLDPLEFCRLALPLAGALAAAHREGVTHRDLKPANVMISDDGRIKVLDFGLAKLMEPAPVGEDDETELISDQETQLGRVIGTLAYMSPEQAEGKPADERSDVFALGILLYRMATGDAPFKGETQISLLSSILKDDPAPIQELRPGASPMLDAIIHRCLEKNPADRYPNAGELVAALEEYKREIDTGELLKSQTSLPGVSAPNVALPRARGGGMRKALGIVAGLAAIAAAALIGQQLFRGDAANASNQPAALEADRRALAVFTFQNITGDRELEWLRDGLTDMLVTDLSQSPDLRVLSTGRMHQFLRELDAESNDAIGADVIQTVAREAGIGTAIVGSYVKAGETLRINVRLQDAVNGELLASERVEGTGDDAVFALVDDLTKRIRKHLTLAGLKQDTDDRDLVAVTTDSVEAYRYYVQGISAHERGDEREALPMLERAVQLDPDFAMALAKLSVAHGNLGDWDKAKEFSRKALDHVGRLTERERFYIEGLSYSRLGEMDRAIEAYRTATEKFPDHSSARNNLAGLLLDRSEYDEAILHLEQLRDQGMTFPGTYSSLAKAYLTRGDQPQAIAVLEDYVEEHPGNASGYTNLASFYLRARRYEDALQALERAERIQPGSSEGKLWDANVYLERWDDATQALRRQRRAPDDPLAWTTDAMAAIQELYFGRVSESDLRLEQAVAKVPPQSKMAIDVATIGAAYAIQLGDTDRAIAIIDGLRPSVDGDADKRNDLDSAAAIAHAFAGNEALAIRYRDDVLAGLDPDNDIRRLWRHTLRGLVALGLERWDEAIAAFKEAEPLLPVMYENTTSYAEVWFGLGLAHWEKGDRDLAAPYFRKLAESGTERLMAPISWVRSHDYLGRYHEERGEPDRARRYYEVFVRYWGDGEIERERVDEVARRLETLSGS